MVTAFLDVWAKTKTAQSDFYFAFMGSCRRFQTVVNISKKYAEVTWWSCFLCVCYCCLCMTGWMREEITYVAPVKYGSCSACLLSNTCSFFLGCRVKGKKECVQGGWEKFEDYARHVARISIELEWGLTCQIWGIINWQQKSSWISLFCLCWALKGTDPLEESWGQRDPVGCSGVAHCRLSLTVVESNCLVASLPPSLCHLPCTHW